METTILLENVTKEYGSFKAVNDLSLQVRSGEILGFLGVNGAGKTTTMRMLAGVLFPSSGKITICGHDLQREASEAKALTGYIPDRPYLYAKLTGREYLNFCSDLYGVEKKVAEERTEELLSEYGLTDWQHALIESYSHGMKQRIATCGALIHRPRVLIIDEPIVGLDPHGAKLLKESLRRYAKEGMSIFLSTHSLHVAEEVADTIAIINKGTLLTTGTVTEIIESVESDDKRLESVFIQLTMESAQAKSVTA